MTNLQKRILTSTLLFLLVIFCIFINWPIYILTIIIVSGIALNEIAILIWRIEKSTSTKNWIPFRLISFIYIFFIFFPMAGSFYSSGPVFIFYILLVCIFSDIGGYAIGKIIGGKRLTTISPNKTISGSLGSFVFSTIPLLLFNLQNYTKASFEVLSINIVFCLIVSLICQLGDLLISYFKRLNKVKDTGTILPGHGGLLDRIDGLIFAIPTVYILKITQIF